MGEVVKMYFKLSDYLLVGGFLALWPLIVCSEVQSDVQSEVQNVQLKPRDLSYLEQQINGLSVADASARVAAIHHLSIAFEGSTDSLNFRELARFDIQNRLSEIALHDSSMQVRLVSLWALGQFALNNVSTDLGVQKKIAQLLKDPSIQIQKSAIDSLGNMPISNLGIQNSLSEFLSHPSKDVVMKTLLAFKNIQSQDRSIWRKIVKLVNHPDESIRMQAISLLVDIDPKNLVVQRDVIIQRFLVKAISDSSFNVSSQALKALEVIAQSSDPSSFNLRPVVIYKLLDILDFETKPLKKLEILDVISYTHTFSDSLVKKLPDPLVLSALTHLLKDTHADIRSKAGDILIRKNGYNSKTQKIVAQLLNDPSEKVQKIIIQAFLDIQLQNFKILVPEVRELITRALAGKQSLKKQGGISCEKIFNS